MRKAIVFLITLFTFLAPTAAQAHDEITGSAPAADSTVVAGAFDVSVTFEEPVMQAQSNEGLLINVKSPSGETVSNGCVWVNDATLATAVDLDVPGTYTVAWRSIGSDGHAVEGTFNFTLENPDGYQSSGIPAITAQCAAQTRTEPADDSGNALIGLFVAIALVAIGSIAGALRFGRKPNSKG